MRFNRWHLGATLALAATAVLGLSGIAAAESPDATSFSAQMVVNNNRSVTVTLSGTWTFAQSCKSVNGIGWAVDWQDPSLTTYPVTETGTNPVTLYLTSTFDGTDTNLCSTSIGTETSTGPWSASHTYSSVSAVPDDDICVNLYNLHGTADSRSTSPSDSLAAGPEHDTDNSLQNGDYAGFPGTWCITLPSGVSVVPELGSWALPAAGGVGVLSVAAASLHITRRRQENELLREVTTD